MITVNGKKLDEYLKNKDVIKDEIERSKLFREHTEFININNHIKPKYNAHKERNGKVRILGTRIVNQHNYENYLKTALKNNNWLDAIVIILIAHPEMEIFTTNKISRILDSFCKKNNIPVKGSLSHKLRGRLGTIRKSKLAGCMIFYERNSPGNKGNTLKYGITQDNLNKFSIDKAINLACSISDDYKDGNNLLNPDRSKRSSPPITNPDPVPAPAPNLINEIIKQLRSLKTDENSVFVINGDVHIHINLESARKN